MGELGLTDMLRRLNDNDTGVPTVPLAHVAALHANPVVQMYEWGGKSNRLLPESWRILKTGVRDAWLAYIVGQPAQGIPPLRSVSAEHVSDPKTRKRYSDFKRLVQTIEDRVQKDGRWSDLCTVDNASRCSTPAENWPSETARQIGRDSWSGRLCGKTCAVHVF